MSELFDRLRQCGVPLCRLSVGMPTIDPVLRGVSFVCWHGRPPVVDPTPHDPQSESNWQKSPIFHARSRDLTRYRCRFEEGGEHQAMPILVELEREGATDYVLHLLSFGEPSSAVSGVAVAFASDGPGGFGDDHLATFEHLMPALGLAARTFSVARTANEALSVYLGPRTGQRVLAGEMRRGSGQRISAAILIADLRGFTQLAQSQDALRVVGWLDEHLEAIGAGVDEHGGEVLKFLGDGLLAIFPFTDGAVDADAVCARTLMAAEQALKQTAELNARRQAQGDPQLALNVVLHAGEVVYGNVGAVRRLDFTVIGPAVNEASRMENLCKSLGFDLLLSSEFAARCGRPTRSLGSFDLRGIEGKRTIRVLS